MAWGVGVENLIARNSPDMLGDKTGTEIAPIWRLNAPKVPCCVKFWREAVRDDGKVRNTIVLGPNAGFRVDSCGRFSMDFFGVPLTKEKLPYCPGLVGYLHGFSNMAG